MTIAVDIVGLSKRFKVNEGYRDLLPWRKRRQTEALRDITLQVPQGEVFGVLGPNGAGKTTLFKILGTLVLPTAGRARVMGLDVVADPRAVRRAHTDVVSEERSLYWRLTGKQNLQYFAALNDVPRREAKHRIADLLSLLGLDDVADRRVMYYSTGMRQKLALARGLLTDPEILLLDEPARSLDPLAARAFWQFIKEELITRQGKTVLLATHNLEEARKVCRRVAVLRQGRVRACGTIAELTAEATGQHRYSLTLAASSNGVTQELADIQGVLGVKAQPSENGGPMHLDVTVARPEVQVPVILERLVAGRKRVLACTPQEQSLDDVLAALTRENS
jgi:ABC-2 type transport system ATP-binding protein